MADEADAPDQQAGADKVAEWDRDVVNSLMGTPQGRYFVERLLEFCGAGRPTYADDGDALGMAKRDGRADVGRRLQGELEQHAPDLFLRMIRERRARVARDQAELRKRQEAADQVEAEMAGRTSIDALVDEQARAGAEAEKHEKAKPKKDR